jgi:carbon storage regulator
VDRTKGSGAVLVLSRRTRDSIMIGHQIVVTVLSIGRDQVRLGIEAPADVEVHREEVYRSIQQANRLAASSAGDVAQLASVLPPGASRRPSGDRPESPSAVTGPGHPAVADGAPEPSSGTATP